MSTVPWWSALLPGCCTSEHKRRASKATKPIEKQPSFSDISTSTSMLSPEDLSVSLVGSNLHVFTLADLKLATKSFSMSNFLGEGGFGPVFKGFIDDKVKPGLKAQAVAVKLLDLDGGQGHKEWLAEVLVLGRFRHPHLVKLIGYCCEDEQRLLVYEFMPRGSLENHLFKNMSDQAAAPGSRTVLRVVAGCFIPEDHKIAAYISSKFRERECRSGHTWRHVDQGMRTFYYDEFVDLLFWLGLFR